MGAKLFVVLGLVYVLCSIGYAVACSSDHCNSAVRIGREGEEDGPAAAEHRENTTALDGPDTKVGSSPRSWRAQTGLYYTSLLRHVHGVLSIIGWGTFMPSGVIIARFFREFPMRCDQWYSAHVLCQTSGYIMGIVGWAFGISLGKSSKRPPKAFLILGIIAIILSTIQMAAVFVQPKKESEWRRWWERYHRMLGYVIIAVMIATIFEGMDAQRHPKTWRWVYVGILGLMALLAAALEITRWVKMKRFKQAIKLNANMYSPT